MGPVSAAKRGRQPRGIPAPVTATRCRANQRVVGRQRPASRPVSFVPGRSRVLCFRRRPSRASRFASLHAADIPGRRPSRPVSPGRVTGDPDVGCHMLSTPGSSVNSHSLPFAPAPSAPQGATGLPGAQGHRNAQSLPSGGAGAVPWAIDSSARAEHPLTRLAADSVAAAVRATTDAARLARTTRPAARRRIPLRPADSVYQGLVDDSKAAGVALTWLSPAGTSLVMSQSVVVEQAGRLRRRAGEAATACLRSRSIHRLSGAGKQRCGQDPTLAAELVSLGRGEAARYVQQRVLHRAAAARASVRRQRAATAAGCTTASGCPRQTAWRSRSSRTSSEVMSGAARALTESRRSLGERDRLEHELLRRIHGHWSLRAQALEEAAPGKHGRRKRTSTTSETWEGSLHDSQQRLSMVRPQTHESSTLTADLCALGATMVSSRPETAERDRATPRPSRRAAWGAQSDPESGAAAGDGGAANQSEGEQDEEYVFDPVPPSRGSSRRWLHGSPQATVILGFEDAADHHALSPPAGRPVTPAEATRGVARQQRRPRTVSAMHLAKHSSMRLEPAALVPNAQSQPSSPAGGARNRQPLRAQLVDDAVAHRQRLADGLVNLQEFVRGAPQTVAEGGRRRKGRQQQHPSSLIGTKESQMPEAKTGPSGDGEKGESQRHPAAATAGSGPSLHRAVTLAAARIVAARDTRTWAPGDSGAAGLQPPQVINPGAMRARLDAIASLRGPYGAATQWRGAVLSSVVTVDADLPAWPAESRSEDVAAADEVRARLEERRARSSRGLPGRKLRVNDAQSHDVLTSGAAPDTERVALDDAARSAGLGHAAAMTSAPADVPTQAGTSPRRRQSHIAPARRRAAAPPSRATGADPSIRGRPVGLTGEGTERLQRFFAVDEVYLPARSPARAIHVRPSRKVEPAARPRRGDELAPWMTDRQAVDAAAEAAMTARPSNRQVVT